MMSIHQLVAGFRSGDAISNEALMLRRIFRDWGYASEIFCERVRVETTWHQEIRTTAEGQAALRPDDLLMLHLSTGSPVNDAFIEWRCRKVIRYHNITPPEFFAGMQDKEFRIQQQGRAQVNKLAGAAELNMAVSRFNAAELEAAGYRGVRVLPLILDPAAWRISPSPAVLEKYRDGLVNVLFVGRCSPNKRLEDGLAAFYFFQRYVEPRSRFLHVGARPYIDPYPALLHLFQRDLHLNDVMFTGSVSQAELNAYYECAHLFLGMSEHEGFCIPLLESMAHRVPVLAYAAAAVPETLDGAGVLFAEKRFDQVAEMMGRLIHEPALRQAVIQGQQARLARYQSRDLVGELRAHLDPLLAQ